VLLCGSDVVPPSWSPSFALNGRDPTESLDSDGVDDRRNMLLKRFVRAEIRGGVDSVIASSFTESAVGEGAANDMSGVVENAVSQQVAKRRLCEVKDPMSLDLKQF
jgi:hypothetical protein